MTKLNNMQNRKFSVLLLWLIFYPFYGFSVCTTSECYELIESHTKLSEGYLGSDSTNITASYDSKLAFWNIFFNNFLQYNPTQPLNYPKMSPYSFYKPSAHLVLQAQYNAINTATLTKTQTDINRYLIRNANGQADSMIDDLYISPQKIEVRFTFPPSEPPGPPNNNYLNIGFFLSPKSYSNDSTNANVGRNYINTINDVILKPFQIRFKNELSSRSPKLTISEWYKHLYDRWNYIANQFVSYSNLYKISLSHTQEPQLGSLVKIPPNNSLPNNASYTEADRYLKTYKVTTPQWTQAVTTETSIVAERETLFVFAEIYKTLLDRYKQKENLLVTMNSIQVVGLRTQQFLQEAMAEGSGNLFGDTPEIPEIPEIPPPGPGGDSPPSGGGTTTSFCFIASTIYGNNSWQADTLRSFRDQHIKDHIIGDMFIKAYYIISPDVCDVLEKNPTLIKPIKAPLDMIVNKIKHT